MENQRIQLPVGRRRYSMEFKSRLVQACMEPGVSVAAVALHHQINA
ncbi:MAG: transposase, partial [Janthinobacterium lividum]